MARTPEYKVYSPDGEYLAACRYPMHAAALVGIHGEGGTIRQGHSLVLWIEGAEGWDAAESYDRTAEIVRLREEAARAYIAEAMRSKRRTVPFREAGLSARRAVPTTPEED